MMTTWIKESISYLINQALCYKDRSVLKETTREELSTFGLSLVRIHITCDKRQ